MLQTTNDWYRAMNNGCLTGYVFLDPKKAFDKLAVYGICELEGKWFKGYLNERKQVVKLGDEISGAMDIDVGVPQGSQLGPLLFSLYVNDLPNIVKSCTVNLFADDTCLYYSSSDLTEIQNMLQDDMNNVNMWLKENSLVFNV